jgi:hypothetical protein
MKGIVRGGALLLLTVVLCWDFASTTSLPCNILNPRRVDCG